MKNQLIMSRLIFLTLLLFFIGSASAQVQSINTPGSKVAVGAMIPITWAYTPQANALPGTLSVIDSVTQSRTIISSTIVLSSKNYQWKVNVPPGSYYLALNDGAGDKLSGAFSVFDANSGTAPTGTSGSTPSGPTNSLGSSNSSSSSGSSSSPGSTKSNVAPAKINFSGSDKFLFSFIVVAATMMYFI